MFSSASAVVILNSLSHSVRQSDPESLCFSNKPPLTSSDPSTFCILLPFIPSHLEQPAGFFQGLASVITAQSICRILTHSPTLTFVETSLDQLRDAPISVAYGLQLNYFLPRGPLCEEISSFTSSNSLLDYDNRPGERCRLASNHAGASPTSHLHPDPAGPRCGKAGRRD